MDLKLMVTNTCPFCKPIIDKIEEENLNIEIINLNEQREYMEVVFNIGGKMQVPMLLIDDEKGMYESKDILEFIEENKEDIN